MDEGPEEDELMSEDEDAQVRYTSCRGQSFMYRCQDEKPSAATTKVQAQAERQQKRQKRKAAEGQLQVKRQEMDKAKVDTSP